MDRREEKGKQLAATGKIRAMGTKWRVPSQSHGSAYMVDLTNDPASCTCPDYELRRRKCKHVHAVEFSILTETTADGTQVVTETVKVTRKTYTQDWPRYNAAQCAEKATVLALLRALCDGIQNPPHPGRGPKPIPLSDAVFAMAAKVYTTASGRRATTDIEACADAGQLAKAPGYNTTFDYFGKAEMIPLLTTLVHESAAPLASIETTFAVDSTGFGTAVYRRWYDHRYGREMKEHGWIKAHATVGTTTNIITAIRVTDGNGSDSPEFPALVAATARRFDVKEVSADKAYLSHENLAKVEEVGAVPFVPFKVNSRGDGSPAWRRMWGLFMLRSDEFLAHYHARSNVESTFSAIKRKFGGSVRSKNFTAQVNEVLCKALCFNLSMLVHAMHELGVEPTFYAPAVH